jgi:hypothetical protein
MATFEAITVTANTIRALLSDAVPRDMFPGVQFRLCQAGNLASSPFSDLGVSIYLHSVTFNNTRRNLPPRSENNGRRFKPSVPLDLHFLITAWARTADQQWALLARAIRALEDFPILTAGFLNHNAGSDATGAVPTVFREYESVELVGEVLSLQDLVSIWEIAKTNQQPSVSFVARGVQIDSTVEVPVGALVQTRVFDAAILAQ